MDEKILDTLEENNALPEDVQEKLSKVIEQYQQMSDEEKKEFFKDTFDVLKEKIAVNTILPAWLAAYQSYILFIVAVSFVAILFVLFTRKLYKRTKDRENRKEMKKKLKEQKKKRK